MPSTTAARADRIGELLRSASDDHLVREIYADAEAIAHSVIGPRDPHLVLSAAHDALLAVLRNRHGFRGDARGSTWLYTVVRREAVRSARRESRRRAVELCLDENSYDRAIASHFEPPDSGARLVAMEVLEECVLNGDWREIWLRYNDPTTRPSHDEVAAEFGRSVGTVAVTLSRVRGLLAHGVDI